MQIVCVAQDGTRSVSVGQAGRWQVSVVRVASWIWRQLGGQRSVDDEDGYDANWDRVEEPRRPTTRSRWQEERHIARLLDRQLDTQSGTR